MIKLLFDSENEPLSALTHFLGFLLSIAGLVLLVVFASKHGTVWHVVGYSIFGTSLILLYGASTTYHLLPITSKAKSVMQIIDHSMIYVLIAGTYTPICFVTLKGAWGWSLFGVGWGLAILGILWKAIGRMNKVVSLIFYILMGWLPVIAFIPLKANLPGAGLMWLLLGGVFYTVGAVIFSLDRVIPRNKWIGMHEVWHLFVMAGSFSHFWLLFFYVL